MAEQLYRKRISPPAASNIDDMVSKNVLAQLRRDPPPRPPTQSHTENSKPGNGASGGGAATGTGVGSGLKGGGVDASDLISSMAKRLGNLERELKERQALLQQVQADNAALKNKLRLAEEEVAKRALAAIEPRDDSAAVMHLRSENARVRAQLKYAWKQVDEMKSFLNDYGMVWMGEPDFEGEAGARETESGDVSSARTAAGGALQSLSPEPSDQLGPRRTSHTGAAIGPSSAAAAVEAGRPLIGTSPDCNNDERQRSHGPSTVGGLSPAAAAALGRAGEAVGLMVRVDSSNSKQSAGLAALGSGPRPTSSVASPRSSGPLSMPMPSPRSSRSTLPVNMAEFKAKVDELNDLAGDGCGQIVRDAGGQHVLATQDPVNIVMYCDGLQIHTLPAKPYNDSASSAVLRDIMDGYFPYVLKRDFPDGVPLRVVDRTSDSINSSPSKRIGGGGGPGNGRGGNIRTFDDIDTQGSGAEPMSREKFLSRLPQAVIKNGKVIEIRSDISRILGGSNAGGDGAKADVALISTPVDALLSTMQRNHVGPSLPPPSREGQNPTTEVTTLQVKSMDGKQTYILKLKYDDSIGSLRACIDAYHAKAGQSGTYEIRSSFPVRAYTDITETLRQAGLVPNATLFLRTV